MDTGSLDQSKLMSQIAQLKSASIDVADALSEMRLHVALAIIKKGHSSGAKPVFENDILNVLATTEKEAPMSGKGRRKRKRGANMKRPKKSPETIAENIDSWDSLYQSEDVIVQTYGSLPSHSKRREAEDLFEDEEVPMDEIKGFDTVKELLKFIEDAGWVEQPDSGDVVVFNGEDFTRIEKGITDFLQKPKSMQAELERKCNEVKALRVAVRALKAQNDKLQDKEPEKDSPAYKIAKALISEGSPSEIPIGNECIVANCELQMEPHDAIDIMSARAVTDVVPRKVSTISFDLEMPGGHVLRAQEVPIDVTTGVKCNG